MVSRNFGDLSTPGLTMSLNGILEVLVSFYRHGQEGAVERHRSRVPVDLEKHSIVAELKKHLVDFLGVKEQVRKFGLGAFALKLYRLVKVKTVENFAIVNDGQWKLEMPKLLSDEGNSELNGEY